MISRYSRPEMASIWSEQNKYRIWLEVETLALEGMAKVGLVPQEAAVELRNKGDFNLEKILEIEAEIKHDVIAFLTNVSEYVGPLSRYIHRGMTSNDLLDTSFAVQLKQSAKIISTGINSVLDRLKARAYEFKTTPCIGRSHGIHAEPTTFGLKLAACYAEIERAKLRFEASVKEVSVGKLAGAVGTYASLPPEVETYVLSSLGLEPETIPTQIVHRDRHAAFFSALALLATSIERFCVEIRHLQRTEVREAEESFTKGQKGSSAMPHKKNPILTENLTGLARLLRSYCQAALENVVLWHERDISHSSAERVIAPDACILIDFMLNRFAGVIENLKVNADQMLKNLNSTRGLVYSGTLLLALVDAGVQRDTAYRMVQSHALPAWEQEPSLKERVLADAEIKKIIKQAEIEDIFNPARHMQYVDFLFERCFTK
jgi:adenylosuccinate lyase